MTKRILIFSLTYYPRFAGGAEVAIKEITDRIGDGDFEFHMVTLRLDATFPHEERIGSVIVHRVGPGRRDLSYAQSFDLLTYILKILYVPLAATKAARLHRERTFDAFWAMMSYMLFPIVILAWRGVRVPYLLTLQEGDPFERVFNRPHIRLFRPLLARGFRRAAAVQVISTYLGAWARRAGFPGEPVVIGNGADIERFSRERALSDVAIVRQALGAREGDVILVTTSRLVAKNAVDDVIRALAHLPAHVRFVVYGEGPLRAALEKLAKETGVAERVRFFGQIAHEELPRVLAACDIFVRPSRSEGMGNSFIEAMAAGLPVIGTKEGGIADFLFDANKDPGKESTGWAVRKDAPEEIARAVDDILKRPHEAKRVTENARKLVTERYDWDGIARRMRTVLDRVAGTGSRRYGSGEAGTIGT